jgi:hypothetical protein
MPDFRILSFLDVWNLHDVDKHGFALLVLGMMRPLAPPWFYPLKEMRRMARMPTQASA